ncbi:MAG: insulinase family protein [Candidatus Rokubacteria bacterium]|nr:insulinase family protein [Candidatus Rokubacteria bacterium]
MTRRRLALVILAVLLAPAGARAQGPTVTRDTLPNGVTVLVRRNPASGVVAVSLLVRAGSRFETPETAGATNFLHRMMIRGTARHSAAELDEAAEEIGGRIDASGDVEYGEVRGTALARHWPTLLALLAEVALEPTLPSVEVEKERRLILSQIQTRADNPFPLAFDTLLRDLYGPHPYALPATGSPSSIGAMTRATLLAHYRSIYRADRFVLAVSGDVSRDAILRSAGRLFGTLPAAGAGPVSTAAAAPVSTGGRRVVDKAAQQAQILVGYLGPGLNDPDYAAVKVLGALLGSGMSGRLFVELRDKRGLAYSLGVQSPFRPGPTFFVGYMGTAPDNVNAAEAGILQELDRIRSELPSESELQRAKAYLLGALAMDRRTNARQAWYLAYFEVVGAGWDFPERYARAVEAVTPADVTGAARRYLSRPTIVVLQPPR